MKCTEGDLIQMFNNGDFDVIIHGTNCQKTMNSGIAKQIKDTFPEVYKVDCNDARTPKEKLGSFSYYVYTSTEKESKIVINAYTQLNWGKGLQVSYYHMEQSLIAIRKFIGFLGKINIKIGYPLIGAGRGGADWNVVSPMLDKHFNGLDHTLVVYKEVDNHYNKGS